MNYYRDFEYIDIRSDSYDEDTIVIEDSIENGSTGSEESNESPFVFEDEYSLSTEDEYEFERIFRQESLYFYEEKIDGNYYLGLCGRISSLDDYYIIASTVSLPSFLYNPYYTILRYLRLHSCLRSTSNKIDIIQLKILEHEDGTYSAIPKTFWLRIVQRRWKQIYKERMNILEKRKSITSIRYREIRGKYPVGLNVLPDLYSMRLLRTSMKGQ